MPKNIPLILASASIGRRWLMEQAGIPFTVMPSGVDEPEGHDVVDPRRYVADLAWLKAAAVVEKVKQSIENTLVLAADSTVWHQGKIIGKPADKIDAYRILGSLAGTTHELWSGVCLWRTRDNKQICWQERSLVHFRELSKQELDDLIATNVWEGKSGGYGIESHGDPYLTVKEGTLSNVVGLPIESLKEVLKWFQ